MAVLRWADFRNGSQASGLSNLVDKLPFTKLQTLRDETGLGLRAVEFSQDILTWNIQAISSYG